MTESASRRLPPNWVGRRRIRLADMLDAKLTEMGYVVRIAAADLTPVSGYWKKEDVYRMEGLIDVQIDGRWHRWSVASWDKVSDLVRGFDVTREAWSFELNATSAACPAGGDSRVAP